MQFRVEASVYESNQLPTLGVGSFGVVYDLGRGAAAKIYHDAPTADGVRKLTRLFDIGRSLEGAGTVDGSVAMPQAPAISVTDSSVLGFSMKAFPGWLRLSMLGFSRAAKDYQVEGSFKFTDAAAVSAIYAMFGILNELASRHLTIGDICEANILINPATASPGFIDVDDSDFEDWDSQSLGTAGYVDPRLLEGNLNAAGGYDFDGQSDVFALTVVAYSLVMGVMPFHLAIRPATWNDDDFLRRRVSSLRILLEGDACLRAHQKTLADPELLSHLRDRVQAIRRVKGKSGADGDLLIEHFQQVFLAEQRSNLLDGLPQGDRRSSSFAMQTRMGTPWVIKTLGQQFGDLRAPSKLELPASQRKSGTPRRDPRSFYAYLSTRGIDLASMVSPS